MTTWEIVKQLFKGSNFHWRKFVIFAVFVAVLSVGTIFWQGQNQTQATAKLEQKVELTNEESTFTNIKINVLSNGKILSNQKDISQALTILPQSYEIKVIVLDQSDEWIDRMRAEVVLPKDLTPTEIHNLKQVIYAVHGVESNNFHFQAPRTLIYEATGISPGATVTIAAYLPKSVLKPSQIKQSIYNLSQIGLENYLVIGLILPAITFITLLVMIFMRRKDQWIFAREKEVINRLPLEMPPAEVGVLTQAQVGAREIAATLIDLANRGYIYITNKGAYFSFGKRKNLNIENAPELQPYERHLLSKIFEPQSFRSTKQDVEMRVGRHIFSRKIAMFYLEVYNRTMQSNLFLKNPAAVHQSWRYTGIALFFLMFFGFLINAFFEIDPKYILLFWVGAMIAALVVVELSRLMPVRSKYGTEILFKWLMFQKYLNLDMPIEAGITSETFIKFLPYAVVLRSEADWAKRFLNENFAKPEWYESSESVVTMESFIEGIFPIINYVGETLAKSHEPTVE